MAEETFTRDPKCMLCRAEKITPWFHEDDVCWIAECDICAVPMVVWRFHGTRPPTEHLDHMRRQTPGVGQHTKTPCTISKDILDGFAGIVGNRVRQDFKIAQRIGRMPVDD